MSDMANTLMSEAFKNQRWLLSYDEKLLEQAIGVIGPSVIEIDVGSSSGKQDLLAPLIDSGLFVGGSLRWNTLQDLGGLRSQKSFDSELLLVAVKEYGREIPSNALTRHLIVMLVNYAAYAAASGENVKVFWIRPPSN